MFTDWTKVDPHYFYGRGFIAGVVFTSLIVYAGYNWWKSRR